MIEYKILRKAGRKTLTISISSRNVIVVKADVLLSDEAIKSFVQKKSSWINKTLKSNLLKKQNYAPKQFRPGEKFMILAKEYPLVLNTALDPKVELSDNKLNIFLKNKYFDDPGYIKQQLVHWYKCAAYEVIFARVQYFKRVTGVDVKEIMIRDLKRSWGNCSLSGIITFSWRLLMGPIKIIDYVVAHEVCHLIFHDHSPRFWSAMSRVIADYKDCKKWLRENEGVFLW